MSNNNYQLKFGCSGIIPAAFIIMFAAKILLHSNISWWIVFAPIILEVALLITAIIILIVVKWKTWTKY